MNSIVLGLLLMGGYAHGQEYAVKKVSADLAQARKIGSSVWEGVPELEVKLLAQMMVKPMPAKAWTGAAKVKIVHDGKFVAFRIRWPDKESSEAGKLGTFSDAVAIQFPVKDGANPPPIPMGMKDDPVHIFHWRAQYQRDEERGKKGIKEIYPNLSSDIYPLEFPDHGAIKGISEDKREAFAHGQAAGNPQASRKRALDELMAEGFGTSAVREDSDSSAHGSWNSGEWTVVISRAMRRPKGSVLKAGELSAFGVAVWQGGMDEAGSRKSVTMLWSPFRIKE